MNMNTEQKKILINKYFDGETSLEEETELKRYFAQSHLENKSENTGIILNYFENERKTNFNGKIRFLETEENNRIRLFSKFSYSITAIAAALIIFFSIIVFSNIDKINNSDTFDDPKQAFSAYQSAMFLMYENLNEGINELESLEIIQEVNNEINNSLDLNRITKEN